MSKLNADYWNRRYESGDFPWDLGHASRPLRSILDEQSDKQVNILIPGAGNGYEAEYAWQRGFHNVFLLDWSKKVLNDFQKRNPEFPAANLLAEDFFEHQGTYDLILEQTFFCALPPNRRKDYAPSVRNLLREGGELQGVMFTFPFITEKGPPWGGSLEEYREMFEPHFREVKVEPCQISEKPRQGNEARIFAKK